MTKQQIKNGEFGAATEIHLAAPGSINQRFSATALLCRLPLPEKWRDRGITIYFFSQVKQV
jgi:hypothetical protein